MLKNEWKAIFKHKFFIIVILALGLIPAIYNYIFLGSMWDPYGHLNELPVAVVNQDKAASLDGKTLKMGNEVVSELKKDKSLDYHFVSEKKADDGIKSGKYYMKITLPEHFSSAAASLMTDHPEKVKVNYQTTSGHNYISSKMSESAMTKLQSKVSENITKSYTSAIFDKLSDLKKGMKTAADGSKKLTDGTSSALTGSKTLSNGLKTLSSSSLTFTDGAKTLNVGLGTYTDGVAQAADGGKQLSTGINSAADGSKQLASGVNESVAGSKKLTDAATQFSAGAGTLASGTQELADKSKDLASGISTVSQSTAAVKDLADGSQKLNKGLNDLAQGTTLSQTEKANIQQVQQGLATLQEQLKNNQVDPNLAQTVTNELKNLQATLPTNLITDQVTATGAAVAGTQAFQSLSAEQQGEILKAVQDSANTGKVPADVSAMSDSLTTLGNQLNRLVPLVSSLGQLPALAEAITSLSSGMSNVNSILTTQINPGMTQLNSDLNQFNTQFSAGAAQLTTGFNQFAAGVNQANSGAQELANKSKELQNGSQQLTNGLGQLQTGSNSLTSGLTRLQTGGTSLVSGLTQLQDNSSALNSGANQLASGSQQIASGSQKLSDGSNSLTGGLDTLNKGTNQLSTGLVSANTQLAGTNSQSKNAKAVASPLKTHHTDHDNVPVNGAGMTPYMINVALFIGALATNVVIGIGFSGDKWKSGREFMLAKIGTNGVVALLQAFIVYGAVILLGLSPNHGWKMLLSVILISFAYMAINTFFLTWLGKVGEFLMIVLLVLQLATSAGTYPLQLAPKIFQVISPVLPMTYGLKMLRETIGLTGQIGLYALGFVILIVIFTGLLSVFKKISRFA